MSRLDAVSYISHGVGKGETSTEAPEVKGVEDSKQEDGKKKSNPR
jgi:ATP-dependent Clp protease ATP-binding subunit ClpA